MDDTPRKRGRRPIDQEERKGYILRIRLTRSQRKALTEVAARYRAKPAAWARDAILRQIRVS